MLCFCDAESLALLQIHCEVPASPASGDAHDSSPLISTRSLDLVRRRAFAEEVDEETYQGRHIPHLCAFEAPASVTSRWMLWCLFVKSPPSQSRTANLIVVG